MPPDAVDRCSIWQFAACVDGWNAVHGAEPKAEPMDGAELDAMVEASAELEARTLAKVTNGKQEPRGVPSPDA